MDDESTLTERERFLVQIAFNLHGYHIMPDQLDDFHLTEVEVHAVRALVVELARLERERQVVSKRAKRRALSLLRSYLSPLQRQQLRTGKAFLCRGTSGGVYRLSPRTAVVEKVERHGTRFYARQSFCLHDYPEDSPDRRPLPPGDVSLSHLLLLSVDEQSFLKEANATDRTDQLWNGAYLRRLRERRTA